MIAARKIDATNGPVVPQIIRYSIPLILSTLVQSLFNAVDVAVLGNMADSGAVASVGATSSIISLIVNSFVGISSGVKVLLARFVGERSREKARVTVDSAVILAVVLGLFISVLGWIGAPWFLQLTNCPQNCYDGALLYIRIYVSAAPAILLYNFCSAILMTAGNTRSPMCYMLAGGVLNLVLNILLCLVMPNKVAAVAVATVASQLLGAALTLLRLCRGEGMIQLHIRGLNCNFAILGKILFFGCPVALSSALYPIATLQIQSAINSYGVSAIAGCSAAGTLENVTNAFINSLAPATGVFIGQNLGAEKHQRVRQSFFNGLWLNALTGGVVGSFLYLTGRFWLGLILPGDPEAMDYAMVKMQCIILFQGIAGLNGVLTQFLENFGYSILTSINAIICVLIFRVIWMNCVYPHFQNFFMLMVCFTVSWMLMLTFNLVMTSIVYSRYRKGKYKRL